MPSSSPEGSPHRRRAAGGKGKRKIVKQTEGRSIQEQLLYRATSYVAGDYVERLETADPRYEWNEHGKRVERKLPKGLSEHDRKVLKKVRKRARCLDYGLNLFGFRFGASALIGDIADLVLGIVLVICEAQRADIPKRLTVKMLLNHAVSELVGLVPMFGDIFIAWWKANSRNSWLLEGFLIERARQNLANQAVENAEQTLEEAAEVEEAEN